MADIASKAEMLRRRKQLSSVASHNDVPFSRRLSSWWIGVGLASAAGLLCGTAFTLGLALGYWHAPPVPQLLTVRQVVKTAAYGRPKPGSELKNQVFIHERVADLIYPPMRSLEDIKVVNDRILVDIDDFGSAYDRLSIRGASKLRVGRSTILRVNFELGGKNYDGYAYIIDPNWHPSRHKRVGTLIIPGTGLNMSTQMLRHSAVLGGKTWLPAFRRSDSDLFLFIKPNEDALAFHNGKAKLSPLVINNYHLNRGGSYAASYIIQSVGVTKYLRSLYPKLVLGGLSQGGAATLLNAIQSKPDLAVIASGYSALGDAIEVSDFDQIVLPGFWRTHTPQEIGRKIASTPTHFLFTYGRDDTPLYRWDAEKNYTCRLLSAAPRVTCKIHGGPHDFSIKAVQAFLEANLGEGRAPRR